MNEFHNLNDAALMDMLALYTSKYTQMILERDMKSQAFYDCKIIVQYLQREIEARKNPTDDNCLILQ